MNPASAPDSGTPPPPLLPGAPTVNKTESLSDPAAAPGEPSQAQAVREVAEKPRPLWAYPATYLLIAINLAVFAIMLPGSPLAQVIRAHNWASVLTTTFDPDRLVYFGASWMPAVIGEHQWWRLVTAAFVHVTLLHLLLNMWCLWNLGLFGEPLLGRPGLIAVYLLTGGAGMLLSLTWAIWSHQALLTAGASGAVFGLAGILIVLLSNRKLSLPWNELRSLRRSVIWFAVLNLGIGMAPQLLPGLDPANLARLHMRPDMLPHVDNTAHIGGFLSGLALGLPLFPRMTSGKSSYRARQRLVFAGAALALCLFSYGLYQFALR